MYVVMENLNHTSRNYIKMIRVRNIWMSYRINVNDAISVVIYQEQDCARLLHIFKEITNII